MSLIASKLNISTSVCVANIDSEFDIESIFEEIIIDKEVLGIKYHNNIRGDIKDTGSFYNQATLRIYVSKCNKEVNLKIFTNGHFQISGVKDEIQAEESIKTFLNKIKNINGKKIVDIIVNDNIIYNKSEYISDLPESRFNFIKIYGIDTNNKYKIIGIKKKNEFIINKVKVEILLDYFVEIKHTNFIKKLYDKNGNYIGYCEYIFKRKIKSLILHGCKYEKIDDYTYNINNKYNVFIGQRIFVIESEPSKYNNLLDLKQIDLMYSSISNKNFLDNFNIKTTNINSNFTLNLDKCFIDKSLLHYTLINKYFLHSYYLPESKYQAINLKLYYDENYNLLKYDTITLFKYKFTALIFQNGKILISGCINKKQIIIVKKFLVKFFNDNYNELIIQKNQNNTIENTNVDENKLSIWDLI